MASAKLWIRWVSTIGAVCLFGAMLYVNLALHNERLGFLALALLLVCSFAYKWAIRP